MSGKQDLELEKLRAENAALKQQNEWLRTELARQDLAIATCRRDAAGEITSYQIGGITYLTAGLVDEFLMHGTAITSIVKDIRAIPLYSAGRRREALTQINGKLMGAVKAYLDFGRRNCFDPQSYSAVLTLASRYERAITEALEGDERALFALLETAIPEWEYSLTTILAIPDRGNRQKEARTSILEEFAGNAHQNNSSWLATARRVIENLTPLNNEWSTADVIQLSELVTAGDSEGCKNFLRPFVRNHNRARALKRAR